MKKKLIQRGLLGFPLGLSLSYVITIVISLIFAGGYYFSVAPALAQAMGSEINAVALQAILSGILGSGFAMASLIWEIESWSIAKQSAVYFAIASAIMLPIAYFTNWMEHSVAGFISYFAVFAGIFAVVWLIQYLGWRAKIKKLNNSVNR